MQGSSAASTLSRNNNQPCCARRPRSRVHTPKRLEEFRATNRKRGAMDARAAHAHAPTGIGQTEKQQGNRQRSAHPGTVQHAMRRRTTHLFAQVDEHCSKLAATRFQHKGRKGKLHQAERGEFKNHAAQPPAGQAAVGSCISSWPLPGHGFTQLSGSRRCLSACGSCSVELPPCFPAALHLLHDCVLLPRRRCDCLERSQAAAARTVVSPLLTPHRCVSFCRIHLRRQRCSISAMSSH
jgi:hypothetical protein